MTLRRFADFTDLMRAYSNVHFIGIGGSGMSGIAEVLINLGYHVSGSDVHHSTTTQHLATLGATIYQGHHEKHVQHADVVVVSSAIQTDNPEWRAAKAKRVPVVPRAEMLGELMRFRTGIAVAGTHGKTTTTSLVASVLAEGGLDPTFVIGGRLNSAGTHARLGQSDYLVAEADESDGSFLLLQPTMAIITNIDADHLENYHNDFTLLQQGFTDFLHHLPFYGLAVLCIDDPNTAQLAKQTPRNVMTYGCSPHADVRAENIRQQEWLMHFDLHLPKQTQSIPITLNLPGIHNVLNATAAAAIGWQLGVSNTAIQHALVSFNGVDRRFHRHSDIKVMDGDAILIEDYGHHPRELAAVFATIRTGWPTRRLCVVFQPHRYSRTRDLLDDFAEVLSLVDVLIITEVYAAGEMPIIHADGKSLARAIRSRGRVDPVFIHSTEDVPQTLSHLVHDRDIVLIMGAGDIGTVAQKLATQQQLPPIT